MASPSAPISDSPSASPSTSASAFPRGAATWRAGRAARRAPTTLSAGRVQRVRLVVLSRLQSLPFDIRRAATAAPGRRAFSITPARWWLRLAIQPLRVEFDAATRQVRRYEGRVPPMQEAGGRLKALDARVDYPRHASIYR